LEFPYGRSKILAEYKKYEYEYDEPIESRVFSKHFRPLASAQQKDRKRPIRMEVHSICRLKHRGQEWITFQVCYRSEDWRHNPISFFPGIQGTYKVPRFRVEIDPNTNEIKKETAQIESLQTFYDISFSKEKVQELLGIFSEDLEPGVQNLTIVDSSGRRHSCSRKEFIDEDYDKLVDKKTGFAAYMEEKERNSQKRK
jgi:hypothetical protein